MQDLRCHFISMSGKSATKLEVTSRHDNSCVLGRKASTQTNKQHLLSLNIPDKIRNATRRTDQLSGRPHVMGKFRLDRCKGVSGTAALHIVRNHASKMCT